MSRTVVVFEVHDSCCRRLLFSTVLVVAIDDVVSVIVDICSFGRLLLVVDGCCWLLTVVVGC